MSEACSIVPFQFQALRTQCSWAPEPVFTVEEAARILGTTKKNLLRQVRHRHPEVKLDQKVFLNLRNTFGSSLTEYGEVRVVLDSPGGPQEHLCFTLYGLFLHALYIRTEEARRFCRAYPLIVEAIVTRQLRSPSQIASRYRFILSAPPRHQAQRVRYLAAETGRSPNTIYRHINRIACGRVTRDGLPIQTKPGPPKGFGTKLQPWMMELLLENWHLGKTKSECHQILISQIGSMEGLKSSLSLTCSQRFLRHHESQL